MRSTNFTLLIALTLTGLSSAGEWTHKTSESSLTTVVPESSSSSSSPPPPPETSETDTCTESETSSETIPESDSCTEPKPTPESDTCTEPKTTPEEECETKSTVITGNSSTWTTGYKVITTVIVPGTPVIITTLCPLPTSSPATPVNPVPVSPIYPVPANGTTVPPTQPTLTPSQPVIPPAPILNTVVGAANVQSVSVGAAMFAALGFLFC